MCWLDMIFIWIILCKAAENTAGNSGGFRLVPIDHDLLPPMKPRSFSKTFYSAEKVELCIAMI